MSFKIGDIVTSRQTGLPAVGKVIAIFDPIYYLLGQSRNDMSYWVKLYPSWKEKNVIIIKYNSPQRSCSLEEFREQNPNIAEELVLSAYEGTVAIPYNAYPEEDLELFSVEAVNV